MAQPDVYLEKLSAFSRMLHLENLSVSPKETEDAARTLCVTVNPVSAYGWKFDKDEFLLRMREAVDVPVINVKEELA